MPLRNPDSCQHFHALDLQETSVFSSHFPVSLDQERIRDIIERQVPEEIDTIFMLHGDSESFETIGKEGAVPLQPFSTQLAIDALGTGSKKRIMRSRHLTLEALTDRANLKTAHVQVDRESGVMQDFSLVITAEHHQKPTDFELRAVVNNPTENVYEVARHENGEEVDSVLIDEAAAREFVHALRETHAGRDIESPSLEAGLLSLIDASREVDHLQEGTYDVSGEQNLTLAIMRHQRIQRGLAKTSSLALQLQETSFNSESETVRMFRLDYDQARKPNYSAELNYLIRAFDSSLTHEQRKERFKELSVFFRENPALLFESLGSASDQLTIFH